MKLEKIAGFLMSVILVFLTLYYPPLLPINMHHVLFVFSILCLANSSKYRLYLKNIIKNFYPFYIIFIYILLIFVFFNGESSALASVFALYIEVSLIATCVIYILNNKTKVKLESAVIGASLLQAIIATAAFFIPSFQSAIVSLFISRGFNSVFSTLAGFRMFGLSYTMAFSMPVVQSIISAYCVFKGITKNWIFYPMAIIILFSSIINARTGIVVFAICLTVVLLYSLKFKYFFRYVFLIGIGLIGLTIITRLLINDLTKGWIETGLDEIFVFISGADGKENSYFSYLSQIDHRQLPSSFASRMFGTGRTTTWDISNQSDIGFINDIWLGGIFYCALAISVHISKLFKVVESTDVSRLRKAILFIGSVAVLLVVNIKGRCFNWNELMVLWMLIYSSFLYKTKGGLEYEKEPDISHYSSVQR